MSNLDAILELAREARTSPDTRRVLFDALEERYGVVFLYTIAKAQYRADENKVGEIVSLRPNRLRAADEALAKELLRGVPRHQLHTILENWHVFSIFPSDVRRFRPREAGETIVVVVVRPRRRETR